MRVIAYLYQDLTWEAQIDRTAWGWEVDQIYQDLDLSRSQLKQLLADCQAQPPDYLLIMRLEDLGESMAAVTHSLQMLENRGVCVVALEQPYQSAESGLTPRSRATAGADKDPPQTSAIQLLDLLDGIQSQQRSRRIRHGHAQNRLKRRPPPGKPPYGYRRGKDRYVIDRSVSPIFKDFVEHFLLYGSLRGAVRYLAKKHSKKISVSTGQRWLTHPVYRGDLVYQQDKVVMGTHAPLISREEGAQIDRLLRRNRSLSPRAASAARSLAGLVMCAQCQSPMGISRVTARGKTQEYLYLRPRNCAAQPKCRSIDYQQVLTATITTICQELSPAIAGVNQGMIGQIKLDLEALISGKQATLAQLSDLERAEVLDEVTAQLRAYTLETEIAQLQRRLTQLPPANLDKIAQTVSIEQFWWDLSETERRFYFREFIRQIEIWRQPSTAWQIRLKFMF